MLPLINALFFDAPRSIKITPRSGLIHGASVSRDQHEASSTRELPGIYQNSNDAWRLTRGCRSRSSVAFFGGFRSRFGRSGGRPNWQTAPLIPRPLKSLAGNRRGASWTSNRWYRHHDDRWPRWSGQFIRGRLKIYFLYFISIIFGPYDSQG